MIDLQRIGRVELLGALPDRVLVPHAAIGESGPTPWLVWIVHRKLMRPIDRRVIDAGPDPGEQEAIAPAMDLEARRLVIDDWAARRLAHNLGLRVVLTVGVLLATKPAGC